MAALEDSQIMFASAVVAGRDHDPVSPRAEADRYLAGLYGLYRRQHLVYAARMILMTGAVRPTRVRVAVFSAVLWVGVKIRWAWAQGSVRLLQPRAAGRWVLPPFAKRGAPGAAADGGSSVFSAARQAFPAAAELGR